MYRYIKVKFLSFAWCFLFVEAPYPPNAGAGYPPMGPPPPGMGPPPPGMGPGYAPAGPYPPPGPEGPGMGPGYPPAGPGFQPAPYPPSKYTRESLLISWTPMVLVLRICSACVKRPRCIMEVKKNKNVKLLVIIRCLGLIMQSPILTLLIRYICQLNIVDSRCISINYPVYLKFYHDYTPMLHTNTVNTMISLDLNT